MSRSGRGPPWIARLSSRWPGCSAGSRSPHRVRGSGNEAGVPFNRRRAWLFGRGNHAALRPRGPVGRLKPMDNAALCRSITATMLTGDVRYGFADDGEHAEEGLSAGAEGQLIPVSGMRERNARAAGRLLFGRGHRLADW